ncbi:mannose-6-phosphate isomerase, class I [Bacillus thuringiensis]|uniref:mannose-6-phosphate isomerase, class I n=1 Tax=Bacillus thuringiensis TaxID=1428 RepID=UPI00119E4CA4|nr:mannose-6-phosphate isomerase, class I [Bacillus thuringiensis]
MFNRIGDVEVEPLFFKPLFKTCIWGGDSLGNEFGYALPSNNTGESWLISAHPNGTSTIENGQYAGFTLGEIWREHPELFGNPKEEFFPLLTKFLDANKDLSVQVHPDDLYAKKNEDEKFGKTECWYILNCKKDAEIILGHHARTKKELVAMIEKGKWDKLLRKVKINPGDFFYIPSGTMHALCEGALVLEIQQSSDTTYRVYDYNREDENGNLRELHLKKAMEVVNVPHISVNNQLSKLVQRNVICTKLVQSKFFSVFKWEVKGRLAFWCNDQYLLCVITKGNGSLVHNNNKYKLKKGMSFMLPINIGEIQLKGNLEVIVFYP